MTGERGIQLELWTSAFCVPCRHARSTVAEATRLIPSATATDHDVAREIVRAEELGIHRTPTLIVRDQTGAEVFRAQGLPTLRQVLLAASRALPDPTGGTDRLGP